MEGLIPGLFLCQGTFSANSNTCSPFLIRNLAPGPVDLFDMFPANVLTQFTFGQPYNFMLQLRADVNFDPAVAVGALVIDSASAALLGSVSIWSLNVTDAADVAIPGAQSQSESGLFTIPEPGTWFLVAAALSIGVVLRRRLAIR